jgi:hypothetical protein
MQIITHGSLRLFRRGSVESTQVRAVAGVLFLLRVQLHPPGDPKHGQQGYEGGPSSLSHSLPVAGNYHLKYGSTSPDLRRA